MTAQADPYVRVYYRIIDDDRFVTVFDDDARLALWLRLLLMADGTYPAPAPIPAGIRRLAFKHLVEVGLVDLAPGGRFRIHGMEAERGGRAAKAAAAANRRWGKDPEGADAVQSDSDSNAGAETLASDVPMLSAPLRSAPLRASPRRTDSSGYTSPPDLVSVRAANGGEHPGKDR